MTALALDPHGDDLALFAAFSVINHKCEVWVTHQTVPGYEVDDALLALGAGRIFSEPEKPHVVFAPAYHPDGHDDHNEVALFADQKWGDKVIHYTTYAPRGQRSKGNIEVGFTGAYVAAKLRALSCFVSQIEQESTRPWFTSLLDVREWYA